MEDLIPQLIPEKGESKKHQQAFQKATKEELELESLIKQIIETKSKGSEMMKLAKEKSIKLGYRSLMNKLDAYRKDGLTGLLRKEKSDKGLLKSFSNEVLQKLQKLFFESQCIIRAYEDTHKWLRSISVEFKPESVVGGNYKIQNGQLYQLESKGITLLQLSTEFVSGEYYTNTGECLQIGSYASSTRYLSYIKNTKADELHFAKFGQESYRLKRQHSIKLDYTNLNPNDLWSADNKKVDIIVIDWDWKSVFRPWLSGFIDVPTRRYTYEITRSANSESISNSFCNAVQKFGLPKEINHDLGKDYLSDRLAKMFSSLNIKVRKSLSRNARAKLIESFHNVLDNKLKNLPGYTGNKYQEMPEETKLMLKQFTKADAIFKNISKKVFDDEFRVTLNSNLEGKIKSSKKRFLHISEFIKALNQALAEYEETLHGGLRKDKLGEKVYDRACMDELVVKFSEKMNTPKGRYNYHVESGFIPVNVEPGVLSIFAMNNALRTAQVSGIHFRGKEYFSPKLKSVLGKKVLIKFTESSEKYIFILHSDEIQKINSEKILRKLPGEIINHSDFICIAELVPTRPYRDESYKEQLGEQRREEKQIKDSLNITKVSGFEGNIHKINQEAEEIFQKNNTKSKLKDSWDE